MVARLNGEKIASPMIFDGHCNTKIFEKFIENKLLPVLKKDMTVVMDNTSFHKSLKIRKLIGKGCSLIFLSPYSPDYNPIEQAIK